MIFSSFWSPFFQKQKYFLQNFEEQNQVDVEVHAETVDHNISLIWALQETSDVQPSDIMARNLLADASKNVLALLRDHIISSAVTPTTLAVSSLTIRTKNNEEPGRSSFEISAEMLEEPRTLGFSWTKIAELLGVSWWTVARRVEEYGLGDIEGFDYLPDEGLDKIVSSYITNHGTATGQNYVGGHLRSLGLKI